MTEQDSIPDGELDAYVDDQLDAAARLRVETYLARHPTDAARVMADLGMRTTLKLALSTNEPTAVRPQTREAAAASPPGSKTAASGAGCSGLRRLPFSSRSAGTPTSRSRRSARAKSMPRYRRRISSIRR